jgi:hypothetical protein
MLKCLQNITEQYLSIYSIELAFVKVLKILIVQLTVGCVELELLGATQWSYVLLLLGCVVLLLTMATIATDRLTRIAYTFAKPRKPSSPRICRAFTQSVVSSTENGRLGVMHRTHWFLPSGGMMRVSSSSSS